MQQKYDRQKSDVIMLIFYVGKHRTSLDTDDYWFGLYKLTRAVNGETTWYDGNPSTYRDWATGEPDENTICIRYTKDGFKDSWWPCLSFYYYTCKKAAGKFIASFVIS